MAVSLPVTGLAFSEGGEALFACSGCWLRVLHPSGAHQLRLLQVLPRHQNATGLALLDDGILAVRGGKHLVLLDLGPGCRNAADPVVLRHLRGTDFVMAAAVSGVVRDGDGAVQDAELCVGYAQNFAEQRRFADGALLAAWVCEAQGVAYCMQVVPRSGARGEWLIVSGTPMGDVHVWAVGPPLEAAAARAAPAQALPGPRAPRRYPPCAVRVQPCASLPRTHAGSVFSLHLDLGARLLLSTGDDRRFRLWRLGVDAATGFPSSLEETASAFAHDGRVWAGRLVGTDRIVTCGEDSKGAVWTRAGERVAALEGHVPTGVWSVAVHPCARVVATGGIDGGVKVWDLDLLRPQPEGGPADLVAPVPHTAFLRPEPAPAPGADSGPPGEAGAADQPAHKKKRRRTAARGSRGSGGFDYDMPCGFAWEAEARMLGVVTAARLLVASPAADPLSWREAVPALPALSVDRDSGAPRRRVEAASKLKCAALSAGSRRRGHVVAVVGDGSGCCTAAWVSRGQDGGDSGVGAVVVRWRAFPVAVETLTALRVPGIGPVLAATSPAVREVRVWSVAAVERALAEAEAAAGAADTVVEAVALLPALWVLEAPSSWGGKFLPRFLAPAPDRRHDASVVVGDASGGVWLFRLPPAPREAGVVAEGGAGSCLAGGWAWERLAGATPCPGPEPGPAGDAALHAGWQAAPCSLPACTVLAPAPAAAVSVPAVSVVRGVQQGRRGRCSALAALPLEGEAGDPVAGEVFASGPDGTVGVLHVVRGPGEGSGAHLAAAAPQSLGTSGQVCSLAVVQGRVLACKERGPERVVVDVRSGACIASVLAPTGHHSSLLASADGQWLFLCLIRSREGAPQTRSGPPLKEVFVRRVAGPARPLPLPCALPSHHGREVNAAVWVGRGLLATCAEDSTVQLAAPGPDGRWAEPMRLPYGLSGRAIAAVPLAAQRAEEAGPVGAASGRWLVVVVGAAQSLSVLEVDRSAGPASRPAVSLLATVRESTSAVEGARHSYNAVALLPCDAPAGGDGGGAVVIAVVGSSEGSIHGLALRCHAAGQGASVASARWQGRPAAARPVDAPVGVTHLGTVPLASAPVLSVAALRLRTGRALVVAGTSAGETAFVPVTLWLRAAGRPWGDEAYAAPGDPRPQPPSPLLRLRSHLMGVNAVGARESGTDVGHDGASRLTVASCGDCESLSVAHIVWTAGESGAIAVGAADTVLGASPTSLRGLWLQGPHVLACGLDQRVDLWRIDLAAAERAWSAAVGDSSRPATLLATAAVQQAAPSAAELPIAAPLGGSAGVEESGAGSGTAGKMRSSPALRDHVFARFRRSDGVKWQRSVPVHVSEIRGFAVVEGGAGGEVEAAVVGQGVQCVATVL